MNEAARCQSTGEISTRYGCTWFDGSDAHGGTDVKIPYPFTSSEITVNYESDFRDGVQQGYLHNIIPQELGLHLGSQGNKPLACVEAQAIAARTFAYFRELYAAQYPPIDNSNVVHVYIPYRYAGLTPDQQARVDAALQTVRYLTLPNDTYPLLAHYGADNGARTHAYPNAKHPAARYLVAVADPISAEHGTEDGTPNGGLPSKGCSRWSFGHTSSRGPAAVDDPNYPHDAAGNGDPWGVQYANAAQILTHYYTNVALQQVGAQQQLYALLPTYRWNPLTIDWTGAAKPAFAWHPGQTVQSTFWIQNSGSAPWTTDFALAARWRLSGKDATVSPSQIRLTEVYSPGMDVQLPLAVTAPTTPGLYTLEIDMQHPDHTFFANREAAAGRRWYTISYRVCVATDVNHPRDDCRMTFLPLVSSPAAAVTGASCQAGQLLLTNGAFTAPVPGSGWETNPPELLTQLNDGSYSLLLGREANAQQSVTQAFTVPEATKALTIRFKLLVRTREWLPMDFDTLTVDILDQDAGASLLEMPFAAWSNRTSPQSQWLQQELHLANLPAGRNHLQLRFQATTNWAWPTDFYVADIAIITGCSS